jgi:hypothetical protein
MNANALHPKRQPGSKVKGVIRVGRHVWLILHDDLTNFLKLGGDQDKSKRFDGDCDSLRQPTLQCSRNRTEHEHVPGVQ